MASILDMVFVGDVESLKNALAQGDYDIDKQYEVRIIIIIIICRLSLCAWYLRLPPLPVLHLWFSSTIFSRTVTVFYCQYVCRMYLFVYVNILMYLLCIWANALIYTSMKMTSLQFFSLLSS